MDAVELFHKALALTHNVAFNAAKDGKEMGVVHSTSNNPLNSSQIHCALAELWITDLCHDPTADDKALHHLETAQIQTDSSSSLTEIYYLRSQLSLNRSQREDAIKWFQQAVISLPLSFETTNPNCLENENRNTSLTNSIQSSDLFNGICLKVKNDSQKDSELGNGFQKDIEEDQVIKEISLEGNLSFDIVFQLAKLGIELSFFLISIRLLEWCLEIQDDLPDLHYLLGLSLLNSTKRENENSSSMSTDVDTLDFSSAVEYAKEHLVIGKKVFILTLNYL